MLSRIFLLVFTLIVAPALFAEPFWGSRISQAVDTPLQQLKPGQFIWKDNAVPLGVMKAVVSISEQKIYLYRNEVLIGISTISTGRGRRSTPSGVFTVLEKNRHHRSRKYHNAPMPYTQFLTADGIAIHAGKLPGYPASHGCIRLPTQFARLLFELSSVGMPVAVTHNKIETFDFSHFITSSVESQDKVIKTVSLSSTEKLRPQPKSTEAELLDIEIQKTQAKLDRIKKELFSIEQRRK